MVKEDHLCVVRALNHFASGEISGLGLIRVNINHFAVALVAELKSGIVVSLHSEVRRVGHHAPLDVPIVETEISLLGLQLPFIHKNSTKVFSLHSVG